jgi:hypothetical protein
VLALYWRLTQPAVRRALSLQDGNPASAQFGCCDRSFWHYRTISSFPAATMQQLALPFAVLFATPFPGNDWYHDAEMLDRARAAMLFWARAQHPCGAVDEWYRNEHSYCATAFTTFGVADAYARLEPELNASDRDEIRRALRRASAWLAERFNERVMNQNLAACAAQWTLSRVNGDAGYASAFRRTWERTIRHQHEEGWFLEYGGADPGYGLLALDLLATLHDHGCTEVVPAATALSGFLSSLAAGDGPVAGRLGSRGTEHCLPFGAETFAPAIVASSALAAHLRRSVARGTVVDPQSVDDRYLAYFYLPSWVLASCLAERELTSVAVPASITWPASGFRVWRDAAGDIVCSTRRRGAFNLYAPGSAVHSNLGFWLEMMDGRRLASCAWTDGVAVSGERADALEIAGPFMRVDDSLPLVSHEVAFRATAQWLLGWPRVADRFHTFLTRRKIDARTGAPFEFRRTFTRDRGALIVRDELRVLPGATPVRAVVPAADIDVHSPSARLRDGLHHDAITVPRSVSEDWADRLNRHSALLLITRYEVDVDGHLRFANIQAKGHEAATQDDETRVL